MPQPDDPADAVRADRDSRITPDQLADAAERTLSVGLVMQAAAAAAPAGPPQPGRWVAGRYRLKERLGGGGMGEVWRAYDRVLERDVALKRIAPGAAAAAMLARFEREAVVTGRLQHPGVLPVYDRVPDDPGFGPGYAMRLTTPGTLADRIAEYHAAGRPPAGLFALVTAVAEVAAAAQYAHDRGVVHRDIKPQNIGADPAGPAVLLDWGLAGEGGPAPGGAVAAATGAERTGFVGTPSYAAPEQAAGEPAGPAADVFALGAVLYEVLTNRPPYPAGGRADADATLAEARAGRPVPVRDRVAAPRALAAVCGTAMRAAPADRYPTAAALGQDLRSWVAGLPVSAYREPVPVRLRRWAGRRPRRVTAAVVLAAAALVGGPLVYAARERADAADARASTADAKAEAADARETAATERAARNRRSAADANATLVTVASLARAGVGTNGPAVRRVIEETLAAVARSRADIGDDPVLRRSHARTLILESELYVNLGDVRRAAGAAEEAGRLLDGPTDPAADAVRAAALYRLGVALALQGDRDGDRAARVRSYEIRRRLADAAPDDPDRLAALAESCRGLSQSAVGRGDWLAAERWEREACRLRERVCGLRPDDPEDRRQLARDTRLLADSQAWVGESTAALELADRAAAVLAGIRTRHPLSDLLMEDQYAAAQGAVSAAVDLDPDLALRRVPPARKLAEEFARADPTDRRWQRALLQTEFQRVRFSPLPAGEKEAALRGLLDKQGQFAAAAEALATADPANLDWQLDTVSIRTNGALLRLLLAGVVEQPGPEIDRAAAILAASAEAVGKLAARSPASARPMADLVMCENMLGAVAQMRGDAAAAARLADAAADRKRDFHRRALAATPADDRGLGHHYELAEHERSEAARLVTATRFADAAAAFARSEASWVVLLAADPNRAAWHQARARMRREWAGAVSLEHLQTGDGSPTTARPAYPAFARHLTAAHADLARAAELEPDRREHRRALVAFFQDLEGRLRIEKNEDARVLRATFGDADAVCKAGLGQREALAGLDPDGPEARPFTVRRRLVGTDALSPGLLERERKLQRSIVQQSSLVAAVTPTFDRHQQALDAVVALVKLLDEDTDGAVAELRRGLDYFARVEKQFPLHPYQVRLRAAFRAELERRTAE